MLDLVVVRGLKPTTNGSRPSSRLAVQPPTHGPVSLVAPCSRSTLPARSCEAWMSAISSRWESGQASRHSAEEGPHAVDQQPSHLTCCNSRPGLRARPPTLTGLHGATRRDWERSSPDNVWMACSSNCLPGTQAAGRVEVVRGRVPRQRDPLRDFGTICLLLIS